MKKSIKSSSRSRIRTCTYSPTLNVQDVKTPINSEVNADSSEAELQQLMNDIKSAISTKLHRIMTSEEFGFEDSEVDDYSRVEVSSATIGEDDEETIRVEVRVELSYDGMLDVKEGLDPIVESYDSYAYFDFDEPGIMSAYVRVNEVDMSVYGATVSTDHMFYDYHGKRFSVHDNSSEIGEDSIDDVYFLWKGNISQQAGAYNDADEDYVYAFIRGRGVIEYYKKGKYVATDNYTLRDEDDFEYAWEYMEIILQHICDRLIAYNKDVPDRMVHNSTDVLAASLQDPIDLDNLPDDFVQAYLAAKEDFESAYEGVFAEVSLVDDSESNDDEVCAIVEGTDVKGKPVSGKVYLYKYTDNYDVIFQALDETADAIGLNDDLKDAVKSSYDFKTSENYKGRRIRLLNDGTGYAIFEKGEMIDYGFKSLEDAEAAIDEYDDIYQDDVQVYSDTEEDEGYWFFTTHGVQPGSVPRDVDILDVIDTPNGSFVKFDRFLSTKELNEYDMVEKAPKSVMSSKESDVRLGDTVESDESLESILSELRDGGFDTSDIYEIRMGLGAYLGYDSEDIEEIVNDLISNGLVNMYSNTSSTDDKVFIEDIIDGLEDNGYDLTRISSIKRGIWELFGYKEKDADIIIHDLIAGGFIDPNNWVDKDYIPSIYSSTEEDSSSRTNSYDHYLGDVVEYNGQTYVIIDDEDNLLTLRPKDRFGDNDFENPELGDSLEDIFLEPWQLADNRKVTGASEEDEDLPMVDQEYDSAATSINSNKLPAIYKMVNFNEGDIIVDFGGGKFDNAVEYIRDKGATLCVYDPYNRSAEHNKEVLRILRENGGADAAVNSNVLNVIKEPEARKNVLENIARITKPGAPIYITVYEGKGDGQEGPTKSGYQLNRKTADYLEEIQEVFPDATRRGKLITAHNSGSVSSATDIQAANNTSYEKYLLNQVRSLLIDKLESEYDIEFFITDMYIDGDDMHIQVYGDDSLHGDVDIPVDYSGDVYDFADDAFNKLKDIFQNNSSNTVEGSQDISRYDKEIVSYRKIISKSVEDSDGFLTDYTMYEVVTEDGSVEYECYFGDNDLYGPWNGEGLDFEADNYDEAVEWYNSYSSDEIQSSESVEGSILDSNTGFRENFEEAVDIFYEEYPATVELTDEQDEEYDTLYKAYVRETGVLYSVKPGVVYIDIDWDSSDILQALEETAEAIGIEHYPDPLDVDASKSIQGDAFSELEDAHLAPPEYDEPTERDVDEEVIELDVDQVIIVDVDGDYEWEDDTYKWAASDGVSGDWRSEDGVYIDDKTGIVEKIDDLISPQVPTRPGKYRVTGDAELVYEVSGILEYKNLGKSEEEYEEEIDANHAAVTYSYRKSEINNLKITPVR